MSYLTPETIEAARFADANLLTTLVILGCTHSLAPNTDTLNVYTSDGVLAFTGTTDAIWAWLRNFSPQLPFAELSPMRRDRLVAAFVSPGRDLLGDLRKFQTSASGDNHTDPDATIVGDIWDCFALHAGWTYLACLESPASVAAEALSLWSSQHDDGWRDDRNANDY